MKLRNKFESKTKQKTESEIRSFIKQHKMQGENCKAVLGDKFVACR